MQILKQDNFYMNIYKCFKVKEKNNENTISKKF
jgi:hypothetical protein